LQMMSSRMSAYELGMNFSISIMRRAYDARGRRNKVGRNPARERA
jgi:hypothetical protein